MTQSEKGFYNDPEKRKFVHRTIDESKTKFFAKFYKNCEEDELTNEAKIIENETSYSGYLGKTEDEEDRVYIANDADSCQMTNGFRYIKELILQKHNLRMYTDHQTLTKNGLKIYRVKTDSFTIDENKLDAAKELLNFDKNIGCWRLSKTDNIYFQKRNSKEYIIKLLKLKNIKKNKYWDR